MATDMVNKMIQKYFKNRIKAIAFIMAHSLLRSEFYIQFIYSHTTGWTKNTLVPYTLSK